MDTKTKGAWLLSHSKNLDAVTGSGAARFENIAYAGRVGRLYNLLRRNIANETKHDVAPETLAYACQLVGIDRPTREAGLDVLQQAGRVDIAKNGSIEILGATSTAVLEATAEVFSDLDPSREEEAVIDLSERVSDKPLVRAEAIELLGDTHNISKKQTDSLVDLCKKTALVDEVQDRDRIILFNSNTFRDGQYASKALQVLDSLTSDEADHLREVQEKLRRNGALYDVDVKKLLGNKLYRRLVSVGLFDRMEVSNNTESVGYIASPNDFQKFGRPFQEDPIDDAKALIASLTYGQTRSDHVRGKITMPQALLRALVRGDEVGKKIKGVQAIGEDYRELEARQVVKVTPQGHNRYTMRLLKRDVGLLALTIVRGGTAAQEAVLMDGSAATAFRGPHEVRMEVRAKNTVNDKRHLTETLDRMRSGG